jgi:hypothetical protein
MNSIQDYLCSPEYLFLLKTITLTHRKSGHDRVDSVSQTLAIQGEALRRLADITEDQASKAIADLKKMMS